MIERLLILLVLAIGLLVPFTLGYDLSDYPEPFMEDGCPTVDIVVGGGNLDVKAMSLISNSLQKRAIIPEQNPCGGKFGVVMYDTEEKDIKDRHIISIGGPCANKITAEIMDLPITWPECALGFEEEVGRIKVYNQWNKTQLVVAGYSGEDTKKAAEVLTNYQDYNLSFNDMGIVGSSNNLSLTFAYVESKTQENIISKGKLYISLVLKDLTHISYPSSASKEEKHNVYERKKELQIKMREQILLSIDESDIKVDHLALSGNGFGGTITKKGFEKLRRNPLVLSIQEPLVGKTLS